MSKQKVYHLYPICVCYGCDKPLEYDVSGSEAAPFGETVSVCKRQFEEIDILQMVFEDDGEEVFPVRGAIR